jgi:2-keto-3-deoxy-L-rhamnonate aldolase RhmA
MKTSLPEKANILEKTSFGTWLTIPHPSVGELVARAGFDWAVVDLEHTAIGLQTAAEMIRVIDLSGARPLVRVGDHNPNTIKRVMDAGAHGIIASTVNTPEQAESIVKAVKYPPVGHRGVGLSRAQGYGDSFEEHYKWLNTQSIVFVQIEHIQAVENLKEILAVPGVDGFFIGPYDLSASLGVPGQFNHPRMMDALERISDVREHSNSTPGVHVVQPIPGDAIARVREGFRFIAYGIDFLFLLTGMRQGLENIKGETL